MKDTGGERSGIAQRALRASGAAAVVVVCVVLLAFEGRTLLVVLAGVLFALALRAPSEWLEKKSGLPRAATLAGLVALVLGGLSLGLYFLGAGIANQADAFAQQLPAAWHSAVGTIEKNPALSRLVGHMSGGPPMPGAEGAKLVAGAGGIFEMVGGLVVVFFLGIYGAAQPDAYSNVVIAVVPPLHRDRARAVLGEAGTTLTHWLVGRLVAMVSVGALVTVGLYVMKVPLAGMLGLLAGLLTFVEYLGAFASAAPAILLALSRGPSYALGVAGLFLVAHIIEGYVLTPLLVRRTVKIPPGYTLAAQLVLGSIFGVVGLTFATPVVIVGTVLVRQLYIRRIQRTALEAAKEKRSAEVQGRALGASTA